MKDTTPSSRQKSENSSNLLQNAARTVYHGVIFDVIQTQMMINGKPEPRDLVVHPGGAAISAVQDGKILLVSQSRAGAGCTTLEIPAGMIDPGESAEEAVLRELNEETGWQAQSAKLLTAFWPTPGYDTEVIWLYQACGLSKAEKRLAMDATEDIQVQWMDLEQAYASVLQGSIRDGKTIMAILFALLEKEKTEQ